MRKNIAVILAAGSGKRFGESLPKQFLNICGLPLIEYSIKTFSNCQLINEIFVVIDCKYKQLFCELVDVKAYPKITKIIDGGRQRYNSSLNAIKSLPEKLLCQINLLFHDAARPLVSEDTIKRVIHALDSHSAVTAAICSSDTIMEADCSHNVVNTPDRKNMYIIQTPQGFNAEVISTAYQKAINDKDFFVTDDCQVVKKYLSANIHIVEGNRENIKLTYKEDMIYIKALLSNSGF